MTKEIFDKATELNKAIEFYTLMEKYLTASGVKSIVNNEIQNHFGEDFCSRLKDDMLPSVSQKLIQAKKDFGNL